MSSRLPRVQEAAAGGISTMEVLTLLAILAGPIIGAWIATKLADHSAKRGRELEVFRTLMRTRNHNMSFDHVSALNLVEVEFLHKRKVIAAWKDYLAELSRPAHAADAEMELVNQRAEDRRRYLSKLLHELAKVLSFRIDQFAVFERNYTPQGWFDDEQQQRYLRVLLLNLLRGQATLPIMVRPPLQDNEHSPYPEPPEAE